MHNLYKYLIIKVIHILYNTEDKKIRLWGKYFLRL